MPTIQQILNNVNLYRNTYTTAQKVQWMDTVQKQIYREVPHEAIPYNFTTLSGFSYYALPGDCDPMGIKKVTIETSVGSEAYKTLDFISVTSTQRVGDNDEFYSVKANQNLFLNPQPDDTTAGRNVYLIYNKQPASLSSNDLSVVPDLEEDFHELLELGVLERVARMRGEVVDKNNFASDYNLLFDRYKERYSKVYPEYPTIKDTLPARRRGFYSRKDRTVADLIPN